MYIYILQIHTDFSTRTKKNSSLTKYLLRITFSVISLYLVTLLDFLHVFLLFFS